MPYPTIKLMRTVPSTFLSGYVCSTRNVVYSACGPQVDVFELDEEGALKEQAAMQSFKLVEYTERLKGASHMDFGGLRHGGHAS